MLKAVGVVAVVAVLSLNLSSSRPAGAEGVASASGVTMEEALEFRSTFGFTTRLDAVLQSMRDPAADTTFGTPLASSEATNMKERQRLEVLADPLEVYIDSNPTAFGGLYLTQNTGRLNAYIQTTSSTSDQDTKAALALVPDGLSVSFVKVGHSMQELQDALETLSGAREKLGIRMGGIDPSRNTLVVEIAPGYGLGAPSTLVDVPVSATFGEGLQLSSCWDTCSPWRGGMHIWDSQFTFGHCTWGFYGTIGTASKYVMTAGHCSEFTHVEKLPGFSNLVFTDAIARNTYDENDITQSDAQTAHVKGNSNATTPFNSIIASSGDLTHAITSVKSNSQPVGAAVCFFGVTTHYASPCGVIQIVNIFDDSVREDGKALRITGLVEMSKVAQGGDSGGPVYAGSAAYGIVHARDASNGKMVYSMAANVQLNTGTSICISTVC